MVALSLLVSMPSYSRLQPDVHFLCINRRSKITAFLGSPDAEALVSCPKHMAAKYTEPLMSQAASMSTPGGQATTCKHTTFSSTLGALAWPHLPPEVEPMMAVMVYTARYSMLLSCIVQPLQSCTFAAHASLLVCVRAPVPGLHTMDLQAAAHVIHA